MSFEKKTIALSGASGGIGRELALLLAAKNCRLILQGRNAEALQALRELLPGGREQHQIVVGNLNEVVVRQQFAQAVVGQKDRFAGLIHSAGISEFGSVLDLSDERIEQMLMTNVATTIALNRDFAGLLLEMPNQDTFIANIGSTFGTIGYAGFAAYSSTKFAVRGFSESLHRELADSRVAVKYIAPRATKTSMNSTAVDALNEKLGNKVDDPELVAQQILDAVANTSLSRAYLGWPEKFFARLNQCFPGVVDGALRSKLSTIKQAF